MIRSVLQLQLLQQLLSYTKKAQENILSFLFSNGAVDGT